MRIVRAALAALKKHRVLIVDDHTVVRQGVRSALASEPDIHVCGEAACAREAEALLQNTSTDVVVLDLTLPDITGIEAIHQLRQVSPTVKIVVLSMHEQPEFARAALRAGANGYVLKSDSLSELASSIRHVINGTLYLSGRFSTEMLVEFLEKRPQLPQARLTPKELEVVTLLANGKKNREIAADLGMSTRTVECHRHRVMQKLHFSSLSDIVRFALRNQLVQP